MKFSFILKSILNDFKKSSKAFSIISFVIFVFIIITNYANIFTFIPVSKDFKDVGLTAVSILFSFQLVLFQSTNYESIEISLNENGKKQLKKHRVTLITNFRIMLIYILISIIFFDNNVITNSIIFVLAVRLVILMMYSTVLYNISTQNKVMLLPKCDISELKINEVNDYDED